MAATEAPLLLEETPGGDGAPAVDDGTTKNQLGTVIGVIVPCLCALWGAILFLRLPWSVGQAGVLGALLTFAAAGATVLLTVLSIAAVSTSGQMGAGGAYYIISRTLGVEAGGSIGIVFFAANSVGITFYLVALASEIDTLVGGNKDPWMIRAYASGALLILLFVSFVGASFFTKLNAVVLALMVASIIAALISFLFGSSTTPGFTGPSAATLSRNLLFDYTVNDTGEPMGFFSVLIIIFPAMTGVMAGANMSGDLKSPGESIGKGTLWAVFIAITVYAALIVVIGASVERETLQNNLNVMQDACFWPPIIAVGLIASTVSSALGNLVGSGRILQALARDELFPFMGIFKWGTKNGDEPIPATLFAWLIAQACIFIGSLDAVAAIISGFFLLVYWAVNASCLLMRVAGAPNFRPKFRYFSWHTALAGAVACLVVLFLSSAVYASISIVIVLGLFIYVGYTAKNTDWGDVTQALIFHQVRKYLLRLDERRLHPKNWRPSLLVCVQDPSSRSALALIDFANNLKKGGLYVLGHVVLGDLSRVGSRLQPLRHAWLDFIDAARVKAFVEVAVAQTARVAYQNLVMCSGLGGLKPNTVVFCLPDVFETAFGGEMVGLVGGQDDEDCDPKSSDALQLSWSTGRGGDKTKSEALEEVIAIAARKVRAIATGTSGMGAVVVDVAADNGTSSLRRRPVGTRVEEEVVSSGASAGMGLELGHVPPGTPSKGCSVSDGGVNDQSSDAAGALDSSDTSGGDGGGNDDDDGGNELDLDGRDQGDSVDEEEAARAAVSPVAPCPAASAISRPSSSPVPMRRADSTTAAKDAEEFLDIIRDCLFLGRNVLLTRGFGELDKGLIVSFAKAAKKERILSEASRLRIDVWTSSRHSVDPQGALLLAMQLSDVLHRSDVWASSTALRVCSIVEYPEEKAEETDRLARFMKEYHYEADIRVVPMLGRRARPVVSELHTRNLSLPDASKVDVMGDAACINEVIRHHCEQTCVLFTPFPSPLPPPKGEHHAESSDPRLSTNAAYLHHLDLLTRGLPPTVLVGSSGRARFVTTDM